MCVDLGIQIRRGRIGVTARLLLFFVYDFFFLCILVAGFVGAVAAVLQPAGLLREHGVNTLSLAVVDTDGAGAGPGGVSLVTTGASRGGVPVRDVRAPGFAELHGG